MTARIRDVQMRILLKENTSLRKIGDLIINKSTADIYYVPSSKEYLDISKTKEIIHFSWHKSGEVLLKVKGEPIKYKRIRHGLKTQQIGFQELFRDLIVEPARLPVFSKKPQKVDILFDLKDCVDPLVLSISIISGRLIVKKYQGQQAPVDFVNVSGLDYVLGLEKRALGNESGNSDKLLQIGLLKVIGDVSKFKTKRRILILSDQEIKNY